MDFFPKEAEDPGLAGYIDRGLWAMFYVSLVVCVAIFIYGITQTTLEGTLRETLLMTGDAPDTSASVEVLWRSGLFGKVQEFLDGEYIFFGKFPLLHSYLVSFLNYLTQDSVLSVFIFHMFVFFALMYLLVFRATSHFPVYLRALFLVFLLANVVSGMLFPWYLRPRTELAVLFIALAFLEKMRPEAKGVMFFLAGITQPLVTGFSCGIFCLESYQKGKFADGVAAIIGMLAASLFYLDLIMSSGSHYLGCASPTADFYTTLLLLLVTCIFLFVKNKTPAQWVCTVVIAIASLDSLMYLVFRKIEYTLLIWVPLLSADLCNSVVAVSFIFPFMFIFLSNKGKPPPSVQRLMLLFSIFCLMVIAGIGLTVSMGQKEEVYLVVSDALEKMDGGHVATMGFNKYEGEYKMVFQDIVLSPIAYLDNRNITFIGTPIPPTYSTPADLHLSVVANKLKSDSGDCAEAVDALEKLEITHLYFAGYTENATLEELERCGLGEIELLFNGSRAYKISK